MEVAVLTRPKPISYAAYGIQDGTAQKQFTFDETMRYTDVRESTSNPISLHSEATLVRYGVPKVLWGCTLYPKMTKDWSRTD